MSYTCQWCGGHSASWSAANHHLNHCPRLTALGFDLETKVKTRKMTIEEAEAEQAARKVIRL